MNDILSFDKMLTPKIITFVYWLMLLGAIVFGLSSMSDAYTGFTIGKFFMGILYIIGMAVGARILCELLIVSFKMNEALQEMKGK